MDSAFHYMLLGLALSVVVLIGYSCCRVGARHDQTFDDPESGFLLDTSDTYDQKSPR